MSLINEALKRTRDASFQSSQLVSAPPAVPYRVTAETRESVVGLRELLLGIIIAALLAAGVIGALYLRGQRSVTPVVALPVAVTPPAPTPAAPAVDPKAEETALVNRLMEKLKAEQTQATPVVATPPAPAAPVMRPSPPPRPLPKLALQGIMRGGKFDEAMINGYTYRVGDVVEGAKVVAIEDGLARLDFDGQEIVLRLR